MPNVSQFGAQTDNATVQGTVTDRAMVIPDIPPQGLMSVGPRVTPHFVKPSLWSALTTYHFFDAVHDAAGASYVATKPEVPAGTELTNEDYWFLWADPNSQFADLSELVKTYDARIDAKAPIDHASEAKTYGTADASKYGHVKLTDESTSTESNDASGIAATPAFVSLIFKKQIPFKTPQMYGAKADGDNDDTDAIQQCLNENNVVVIPEGVYKITKELTISRSDVTVMGASQTKTVIKQTTANLDVFAIKGSANNYIRNINFGNMTLTGDFVWEGHEAGKNGTTKNGLGLSYVNLSNFTALNLTKNPGNGAELYTHCWALIFNECLFNVNGECGLKCTSSFISAIELNGGNLRFDKCYMSNNIESGIKFNGADLVVTNSWLEGNDHAVELYLTDFDVQGVTFDNCDIEGNKNEPLYFNYAGSNTFDHFYFKGALNTSKAMCLIKNNPNSVVNDFYIDSSLPIQSFGNADNTISFYTNLAIEGSANVKLLPYPGNTAQVTHVVEALETNTGVFENSLKLTTENGKSIIIDCQKFHSISAISGKADQSFTYVIVSKGTAVSSGVSNGDFTISTYAQSPTIIINYYQGVCNITDLKVSGYRIID